MSLARRLHQIPRRIEQNAHGLAPVACALQWSSPRLPPCENDTVLNDPLLVYDLLLRWHIQGDCLCSQTVIGRFCARALVALVEIQVQMVVEDLPSVVATQEL